MLFLMVSFLEVVTLSIIGPYLSLLTSPDAFLSKYENYLPNFFQGMEVNILILLFGILMVITILLKSSIFIICHFFINKFSWNEVIKIRSKLITSYNNLDYEKFIMKTSSDYINTVTSLSVRFLRMCLLPSLQICSDLILILSIIIFLIFTDIYVFFLLSVLFIVISIFFDFFLKKRLIIYGEKMNEGQVEAIKGIKDNFEGYKEIKILKKSGLFKQIILNGTKIVAEFKVKLGVINLLPRAIIEVLAVLIFVLFICYTIILNENNFADITPNLVIFFLAALKLGPAVSTINVNINNLRVGKFSLDKLYNEIQDKKKTNYIRTNYKSDLFASFHSISINNLSYKYPSSQNYHSIKNLNFEIKKGEIIGIAGPSGSGKTTCVDLILGLLKPTNGEIKINDITLQNSNIGSWQEKIAYLPQEFFLINDTILKNITLSDNADYDDNFLQAIILKTNLNKFIEQLPDGINTFVGDRGVNLSGGQRQRISIARSLYHKREILVLDESTSSLDFKTEKNVIEQISLLKNETTIILISHNINLLTVCDQIIYIEDGHLKKLGKFSEVFND